jgi:hypothetical protein
MGALIGRLADPVTVFFSVGLFRSFGKHEQTILKGANVYKDGKIEPEFRG